MKFELIPIIDKMKGLYSTPPSASRFQEYLTALQGNTKGDMSLPISGFNPMAKEHVVEKLDELIHLKAEDIIAQTLDKFNTRKENTKTDRTIKLVLNLADDLKGGWTNYYTTDFDSKFKLNPFVTRNFCVPYFWTSENYTEEMIIERTLAYVFRTVYWMENSKPISLEEHLQQEVYVAKRTKAKSTLIDKDKYTNIEAFFARNMDKDDYNLIFNFFYGDKASKSLGFKTFGINAYTGFHFAIDYKKN